MMNPAALIWFWFCGGVCVFYCVIAVFALADNSYSGNVVGGISGVTALLLAAMFWAVWKWGGIR